MFNLGSFLGITLVFQVVSGLLLVLNYNTLQSYESVSYIVSEVYLGWFIKLFHSNNASLIFFLLYLHLYKNVLISSYRLTSTWNSGLVIILLIMGAGFSGYVLVGSQISYWAAMVITSLIGVIPVKGEELLYWIWGGYSVSSSTLGLMFLVHFLLPLLTLLVMCVHLFTLHSSGSTSLVYSHAGVCKVTFYPYFWVKDIVNLVVYMFFVALILLYPYSLGEVELFSEEDTLVSPVHIVPEWYFCSQYAMLRSVPSKGVGVLIMLASVLVYFLYPLSVSYVTPASNFNFVVVSFMLGVQVVLTFLGFAPIEQPFVCLSVVFTFIYFILHVLVMSVNLLTSMCFSLDGEVRSPLWYTDSEYGVCNIVYGPTSPTSLRGKIAKWLKS